MVIQAYSDKGKDQVLCQSPTIQRISQRIILWLAILIPEKTELYLRDITQAYTQSKSNLVRDFYFKPQKELLALADLPKKTIYKVIKPLYGVPESGNHWFKTYHDHHTEKLGMKQSTFDPCLFYRNQDAFGIIRL